MNVYSNILKTIEQIKNKKIKEYELFPLDATLLNEIQKMQKNKKIKCIFIPNCTVQKDTDGNIPE